MRTREIKMSIISPTPYPEVSEILDVLLSNVKEILQDQFVGIYLFGSLANGDFDDYSDIDVLIITAREISDHKFDLLKEMHERIQKIDSPWAIQLEVSYIPINALRRYDPNNNQHPHLDRGTGEKLHVMKHDADWVVQRHILRERGIALVGPEPKTMIDFVSADDLRKAMQPILFEWYASLLKEPNPFRSRGQQSFNVLSLCRILYTLQMGEVVSKVAATRWAKEVLNSRWIPLIDRALIGRKNPTSEPLPEDVSETLAMIRYAMLRAKPTPYPDVNEVLNLLLTNVKEILQAQFVGTYLYGSLSSGDFNPETSDIDFLVVTTDFLSEKTIKELENMHKQTWATSLKRAGELEGSYIPKSLIRRHDPNGAPCPTVNEGKFFIDQRGSDWIIQRHVVREYGIVMEGPDPKTLIDFVRPEDIRGAVRGILHEWWFPMLDDPSWLRDNKNAYRAFAAITMCRVLHALETGTVVSKPKAIQWAQAKLDAPWKQLVDKAAIAAHDDHEIILNETLDFIRFVHEKVE